MPQRHIGIRPTAVLPDRVTAHLGPTIRPCITQKDLKFLCASSVGRDFFPSTTRCGTSSRYAMVSEGPCFKRKPGFSNCKSKSFLWSPATREGTCQCLASERRGTGKIDSGLMYGSRLSMVYLSLRSPRGYGCSCVWVGFGRIT